LLDALKQRYMIDVYHDSGYVPHLALQAFDIGCFDYRLFERHVTVMSYHAILYQMAGSHFHNYMYKLLKRYPGIVTLHDAALDEPARGSFEGATAVITLAPTGGSASPEADQYAPERHESTGAQRPLAWLTEKRGEFDGLSRQAVWYPLTRNHGWPSLADSYEEIIERTVSALGRLPADPISNLQGLQLPGSAQWLQHLS
jgi:hypothetical protein